MHLVQRQTWTCVYWFDTKNDAKNAFTDDADVYVISRLCSMNVSLPGHSLHILVNIYIIYFVNSVDPDKAAHNDC